MNEKRTITGSGGNAKLPTTFTLEGVATTPKLRKGDRAIVQGVACKVMKATYMVDGRAFVRFKKLPVQAEAK